MKTNVCLISSLRRPFRSFLLFFLFGLISFGFIAKAVEYILVQHETELLGTYYRSIGVLENVKDPQSGDVSAGIKMIETSPFFAYGDLRRMASGVMQKTYSNFTLVANSSIYNALPKNRWPNVHNTDIWFIGELIEREDINDDYRSESKKTIGYYLEFNVDTLLASFPGNATQGSSKSLLFMFEGHEAAIPMIQELEVGQRYLIRCWLDIGFQSGDYWENVHGTLYQIIPIDDKQLWYMPVAKGTSIDFNAPEMSLIKNEIDVLNENLHTLYVVATSDLSAMPWTQEASRTFYLTEGRWLNHQDELAGSKLIVIPQAFAQMRRLKLGDEIQLTFRPLKDTYCGLIRDGIDKNAWRDYPIYTETFRIIGLYNDTSGSPVIEFIPNSSLPDGFESSSEPQFRYGLGYSFVLNSSKNQTKFIQEFKVPLQELGFSLTFLENNGEAYWASVDPIRHSLSADVLIYGGLTVIALLMAVFLYNMQHRREYAILRTLGVAKKQANRQFILPLLIMAGLGIILGGLPSWNYAINQAKTSLSILPTPAGVYPSADLNPFFLVGLCAAIFLLLALFSLLGVFLLSYKPVYELLQGQAFRSKVSQKRERLGGFSETIPTLHSSLPSTVIDKKITLQVSGVGKVNPSLRRKYNPSSLSQYVLHHVLRSRFKSLLTLAIGLVFLLASGWILRTMEQSRKEVDHLYDTTVVEADIIRDFSSTSASGRVYGIPRNNIDSVMNSGFVKSNVLEAETTWLDIMKLDLQGEFSGLFPVEAYDNPDMLSLSLVDPESLVFAPGWDINLFSKQWTAEEIKKEGMPAIFPASLLAQLKLSLGQVVKITDQFNQKYPCVIVGQYSGERSVTVNTIKFIIMNSAGYSILIPLSGLESMERSQTQFTIAHFVLDPKKNRELPQFRTDMEKIFGKYDVQTGGIRLIIWDEELRVVVAQLEKNISILKVLYPVLIAVSVLIGAGLCFLLLVQAAKEAAILRMLGTTRTAVRIALIIEPFVLSIIGVIIGLGVFRFLGMASDIVPVGPLLIGAGLYLAGVLAGLVIGAISVTSKKPMELLQVKE